MKLFVQLVFICLTAPIVAQESENLIPKDAVSVFSINNFSLLNKISLDELVKYEFMEEIQAELFDGSTHGKTIKDSGIDFEKKLNVFYGKGLNYEVSGFTFGISNKKQLFEVFDDFERIDSGYDGVERYASYFNQLIIKGNNGLLIRVEPNEDLVLNQTDSLWYARGNLYPWNEFDEFEGFDDDDDTPIIEEIEESETYYEEHIVFDSEDPVAVEEFPEAEEITSKTYYELRDSVEYELQKRYLKTVCDGLFIQNESLLSFDSNLAEQLTHNSDGIFYLDNSRNFQKDQGFWYMKTMFPDLFRDMQDLYTGNVILGDLVLNDNNINLHIKANYGENLGSIYEKMNTAKFDKNVLKYIHKDNAAFFTYNVNLREAYEQAYDVIVPILYEEKNARIAANVLALELLNEFINKDALFDTYKGSMFGSFNGIQKVKTRKIEFTYDEETFEYSEREVEAEEDMPIFTLGFSTERGDIPEKVLKHLSKLTSRFKNMGDYWQFDDAVLDAAPLYFINKNDLFILTNDESLAKEHSNGYGSDAISGKKAKKIRKNGFMYGEVDWGSTIDRLPNDLFDEKQNEILDAMRGKTGKLVLTSSETTKERTTFDITYTFNGEYENAGKYVLDLINSVYVISK